MKTNRILEEQSINELFTHQANHCLRKNFHSRISSSLTDNIPKWADDFLSEKDMTGDEIFFYLTEI